MSTTTAAPKTRTPRKAPVKAAVEAAAPARKPRAKKTLGATPAVARVAHQKVAFPIIARQLSAGFADFSRKLEAMKDSVLTLGSMEALVAAMLRKGVTHPRLSFHHRNAGTRAHRVWARRRAAGRA